MFIEWVRKQGRWRLKEGEDIVFELFNGRVVYMSYVYSFKEEDKRVFFGRNVKEDER